MSGLRAVKRFLLLATGCVAVLGLAVAVAYYAWLPNNRPGLEAGEQLGIDVSHHQGEIDWSAVAADEVSFAYIKSTEGGDWVDPRFDENWEAAQLAGVDVGAYHFFRTCTDGALQAQNILDTVPAGGDLPLAIDIEGHGICDDPTTGLPADNATVTEELEQMMAIVEAERGPVIFYILEGFDYLDPITTTRAAWQRSLLRRPDNDEWLVWQFSNQVFVDGIDGRVDVNVRSAEN